MDSPCTSHLLTITAEVPECAVDCLDVVEVAKKDVGPNGVFKEDVNAWAGVSTYVRRVGLLCEPYCGLCSDGHNVGAAYPLFARGDTALKQMIDRAGISARLRLRYQLKRLMYQLEHRYSEHTVSYHVLSALAMISSRERIIAEL